MMRTALIALAGVFAVVAVAAAAPSAREAAATLRLTSTEPLTLRGAAFKPHERVTLAVRIDSTSQRRTRSLRANARGGFVARFTSLRGVHRCDVVATAVGARGTRAAVKLPQALCRPSGSRATLRLTDTAPVSVAGAAFVPREAVTLRASGVGPTRERRVIAGAQGRFTATFGDLVVADRCSASLIVRAVGARGSQAVAKLGPAPQCPPRG